MMQKSGGEQMIGFILGTVFGGTVGVFTTCMCVAAGQEDRRMHNTDADEPS